MLERGIRAAVTADGAVVVLVNVVSPGTREKQFGGEKLTFMPAAALVV